MPPIIDAGRLAADNGVQPHLDAPPTPFRQCVIIRLCATFLFFFVAWMPVSATPGPDRGNASSGISLLFHGSLRGTLRHEGSLLLARAAGTASASRQAKADLLYLCNGNMLGPSFSSSADGGAWVMESLAAARVDALVPGPYDLFAGEQNFWNLVAGASFPVVWTNLSPVASAGTASTAGSVGRLGIEPWARFHRGETAIRLFGLISPDILRTWPGWPSSLQTRAPADCLASAAIEAGPASWTVVMGTLDPREAIELLRKFPWIDILIVNPGTSEDPIEDLGFEYGLLDGRRLFWTQPPGICMGLVEGRRDAGRLELQSRRLFLDADACEDPVLAVRLAAFEEEVSRRGQKPLRTLSPDELASFPETLVAGLCFELDAEVGLLPAAGIKALPQGNDLTTGDVRRAYPYADRVAVVPVTGKVLEALWKSRLPPSAGGQGLILTGLRMSRKTLLINGRPVNPTETYRLATVEYLSRGGLDLLPNTGAAGIGQETFNAVLTRHFSRDFRGGRLTALDRHARRPILKHHTSVGVSYNDTGFGGSAPSYKTPEKGGFFMGRDVPGLVGKPHRTLDLLLNWKTTFSEVDHDWIFRGENTVTERDGERTIDRSKLIFRWSRVRKLERYPQPFVEISTLRPFGTSQASEGKPPLFIQSMAGWQWRGSPSLKFLAGIIHMVRQSWPAKPRNTGLEIRYDFEATLKNRWSFASDLGFFATGDADQIRMFEGGLSLKYKLNDDFALTWRENAFGWKEAAVSRFATRRDSFFGLTCEKGMRRLRAFRKPGMVEFSDDKTK